MPDTGGFLVVYQPLPDTDAAEKLALPAASITSCERAGAR
jgi:hypothetical protein